MGILVGESPGRDEADKGEPFVGPTGEELTDQLIAHGLRRTKLFIVNAICCIPPINKTEVMMKQAADCCRPALIGQLEALNQPLPPILFMGKWAAYGGGVRQRPGKTKLAKMKGIMNSRGFVRPYSLDRAKTAEEIVRRKHEKKLDSAKRKKARSHEAGSDDGEEGSQDKGAGSGSPVVRPRVPAPAGGGRGKKADR